MDNRLNLIRTSLTFTNTSVWWNCLSDCSNNHKLRQFYIDVITADGLCIGFYQVFIHTAVSLLDCLHREVILLRCIYLRCLSWSYQARYRPSSRYTTTTTVIVAVKCKSRLLEVIIFTEATVLKTTEAATSVASNVATALATEDRKEWQKLIGAGSHTPASQQVTWWWWWWWCNTLTWSIMVSKHKTQQQLCNLYTTAIMLFMHSNTQHIK